MTGRRVNMRPGVRQARISDLVAKRGEVSVEVLAQKFDTSAETIRRDLTQLADAGLVRKIHGGARMISSQGEAIFDTRMRRNALAKHLIAEKAAALVKPHETIFMDTGSTTLICAEVLSKVKDLTVITNSTRIAAAFAGGSGGAEVYLLGGVYRADNAQTVGDRAICEVAGYRADHAIITIGALDSGGLMDFSSQEAMVARAMIKASAKVTALVDHSKFNSRAAFEVCDLSVLDTLVCDRSPEGALLESLRQSGTEVL